MIHINDLEQKIEAIINFTNDEKVLKDCESWFSTIEIMRDLNLYYMTLEDESGDVIEWNPH